MTLVLLLGDTGAPVGDLMGETGELALEWVSRGDIINEDDVEFGWMELSRFQKRTVPSDEWVANECGGMAELGSTLVGHGY